MKEVVLKVKGMTCQHCVRTVKNALSSLDGVSDVEVHLETGTVKVNLSKDVAFEELKKSIEEWGYKVVE
jgi:copper ion binding protein